MRRRFHITLPDILFIILLSFQQPTVSGQTGDSIPRAQSRPDAYKEVIPTKDNYLFVYDGFYDMTGSAQNLFTVSRLFGRGLDELVCLQDDITGFNYCLGKEGYIGRVVIDIGLNLLFNNWLSTIQHECMGHGFRVREFDVDIRRYYISPGLLAGKAYVDFDREDLPYYGLLLESAGGSESNTEFAREAFRQSLPEDYFYHYYVYSFINKIDLSMYILGGTPKVGSDEWNNPTHGRDVINYIKMFKSKSADTEQQIYQDAKMGAIWSLLDPSLLISFFNYFRDFMIQGKSQVENPMIGIRNIRFLPFTDFHLTPFGSEYCAGLYLKKNKALYETYFRWGNGNIDGKCQGLGLKITNALQYDHLRLDAGFDFWKQDFNLLYYEKDDAKYEEKVISGKLFVKAHYQISHTLSVVGQTSYKGEGFLPGNPVESGLNAKIGLGFYF